jgi:uncharacterized membrane protein
VSELRAGLESVAVGALTRWRVGAFRLRRFERAAPTVSAQSEKQSEVLNAPTRQRANAPTAALIVGSMTVGWAALFAWLAVTRHLAGGSHAEDLGFTDQVLSNFLRGQWFRMSIYQGATWNTEIDISSIARPDSLLAFHFEPMLLLFVPLYAVGGGATLLLILQSIGLALGAVPAYRLANLASGSSVAGMAVAAAYLLSPLGQWAVLSDFHTATLAAPLLLLCVERLIVGRSPLQALIVGGLAATAREDVGFVLAAIGLVYVVRRRAVRTGVKFLILGSAASILGALVIRTYSGDVSPFDVRYAATVSAGLGPAVEALARPNVVDYAVTLMLSGAWLAVLAPVALVPALPALTLNVLSTSAWMAAGKAHYSVLVLPFIVVGAAAGLRQLKTRPRLIHIATAAVLASSIVGYVREGAGPLGGNYVAAAVTEHARRAAALADALPTSASISASSSLVPRVSSRTKVYVFPAVLDADYVFLDLRSSPAPTSAGDVFLRANALVRDGGWQVDAAEDGLLLLERGDGPAQVTGLFDVADRPTTTDSTEAVTLVSATLVPSPDAAIDVDGPHWILRTVWQANRVLPPGTRLEFWIDQRDGQAVHRWDLAELWWNPPEAWKPGVPVSVDVPDVPQRQFVSWRPEWSMP